jgi:translation initiation factor 6
MFRRLDPFGNPNVGVYVRATSRHLFVPLHITKKERGMLEESLGLESTQITLGGSTLIGSLMAANENGAIVSDIVTDHEIEALRDTGLKVARLQSTRLNAAGNNILANDMGAIVHPNISKKAAALVSEVLGVPVAHGYIAGIPTVGTAGVATNKGVLAHPLATEDELGFLKQSLHATARIGTVNHGHGLVGAGLAANQHGAAAGSRTTGIELGRIEEALGYLE